MARSNMEEIPSRIHDLVVLRRKGATITCHPSFLLHPVEFQHQERSFEAFVFVCLFSGSVNGREYAFRKCYARGCQHNLCPHVSQAVMIANRYLERDYHILEKVGIECERKLFTLEDMLVKFNDYDSAFGPPLTIRDYINIAREGAEVSVDVQLECVAAVEHFLGHDAERMFYLVRYDVTSLGVERECQHCLGCYETTREREERPRQMAIANDRLREAYEEFDEAGIECTKRYFT